MMTRGLEIGFLLDRQWHALRGEMETTKRPAIMALARVLADTATPYAVIGGSPSRSTERSLGRRLTSTWLFRAWR